LPIDADPECDNINFANYKGIYAEDDTADQKYTCPITGAHFEFNDVCRRLQKVIEKRRPYEDTLYGKTPLPHNISGLTGDDFTVSCLSVSDELVAQAAKLNAQMKQNIQVSSQNLSPNECYSSKTSLKKVSFGRCPVSTKGSRRRLTTYNLRNNSQSLLQNLSKITFLQKLSKRAKED
jgi:hypothetical protein